MANPTSSASTPSDGKPGAKPDATLLAQYANQLRIDSIRATTAAGSGHPTSCASAADLIAALFFSQMKFDPRAPHTPGTDRFILSKGHAAPILYSAWARSGAFPAEELVNLRKISSVLEGHPTPRIPFVDLATGSLGQGLAAGVGMAIGMGLKQAKSSVYVMMGDGECAEGSVWEAASLAGIKKLSRLMAIVDVNRYGQSGETAFGADAEVYRRRFDAFGWHAETIDGHDMPAILDAFARFSAAGGEGKPWAICASTLKGKGIAIAENKPKWHGKALSKEEADVAVKALEPLARIPELKSAAPALQVAPARKDAKIELGALPAPAYKLGEEVAPRKAYGNALARLAKAAPDLVVLDGDVGNSTYAEEFGKVAKDRYVECYIAEQTLVGAALGLSTLGFQPFAGTFAAFLSRAYDQIRMGAISLGNLKLVGTHAGISIGEDGGSQMALEDIASLRAIEGSVVLSPSDAMSAERLIERMLVHQGISYLRAARAETPVLYGPEEKFEIGGAKILRQGDGDAVTVVATGVTVAEAVAAEKTLRAEGVGITVIDAYSIKPLARDVIAQAMGRTRGRIITVEDHYAEGGLGDAVAGELSREGAQVRKLAVMDLPHSGTKKELLAKYKIDAAAIAAAVKTWVGEKK